MSEPNFSSPPQSYFVGDQLDWESPLLSVHLVVELPFFLMMNPSVVRINHGSTTHRLHVAENDVEVFVGQFRDSRRLCGYQGHEPDKFESRSDIQELGVPLIPRQQRTTVSFQARCHEGILRSAGDMSDPSKSRLAGQYLASLCEAHLPILNELVRRYRLTTYDYFAYQVSAWDVPIWHVRVGPTAHVSVVLFDYAGFEARPLIYAEGLMPGNTPTEAQEHVPLTLIDGAALESLDPNTGVPGEDDLLDARNLMERGDYSGAVRRTTTAIEALVEHVLRVELQKAYGASEVEVKLFASQNDFPGRYRQWKRLSGAEVSSQLEDNLEVTRTLRHEIVHKGRRITFEERGTAQRCVDTGRWMFNHIERDPTRRNLRENNNTVRAIARPTLAFRFPVEDTSDGFIVKSLREELGE
jgi:hypothetical protein